MESRRCTVCQTPVEGQERAALVCCPILSQGDVTGSVLLLSGSQETPATEMQSKLAQTAAAFLSKQLED